MVYPKVWHARRYPTDTVYVMTHVSWAGRPEILIETADTEAQFHDVRHDPYHPEYGRTRTTFTVLERCTITAGTSWVDAIAQLSARVPVVYQDLEVHLTLIGPQQERYVTLPAR